MKKTMFGTYITIVICAVITLLIHIYPYSSSLTEKSIFFGAYYKAFIIAGEWWRMVTCGLVHVEIPHLLMNMFSLWMLGSTLEQLYGTKKFLLLLFVSVLGGSVFLFVSSGNTVAVGLSGGIYGLFASYIFLVGMGGGFHDAAVRNSLLRTALLNIAINFLPGIAWKAHFGGAIAGLLLTMILHDNPNWKALRVNSMIAFAGMVILCYAGIRKSAYIPSSQRYVKTDQNILKMEWNLGAHTHVRQMAARLDSLYDITYLEPMFREEKGYAEANGNTQLG